MNPFLGILGDPAKLEKYTAEYYEILKNEASTAVFHLIGASEYDVNKYDYLEMYQKFEKVLSESEFSEFQVFTKNSVKYKFQSRIGLFPSHRDQLISGPDFVFAPFPANSESLRLKLKARVTISLFSRFSSHNIIKIAYFPLGGKAAQRTKAHRNTDLMLISEGFSDALNNSWFDWVYLEAGSGESTLKPKDIGSVISGFISQNQEAADSLVEINNHKDVQRLIIPKTIYGGGITSPSILSGILEPKSSESIFIPETIVVGNISEKDISATYNIIEKFDELNEISTLRL